MGFDYFLGIPVSVWHDFTIWFLIQVCKIHLNGNFSSTNVLKQVSTEVKVLRKNSVSEDLKLDIS